FSLSCLGDVTLHLPLIRGGEHIPARLRLDRRRLLLGQADEAAMHDLPNARRMPGREHRADGGRDLPLRVDFRLLVRMAHDTCDQRLEYSFGEVAVPRPV